MLTTCPYFDNLNFDISDSGGPQCHFVTSALRAGRLPNVHWHLGAKRFTSISDFYPYCISTNIAHMKSHLRCV